MDQPLPRRSPDESVRFAVFGDNQVYAFEAEPPFLALLEVVRAARPDFVVMVGDAIYSETSDRDVLARKWSAYRGAVATLPCPVVQVPGNHDAFDGPSLALWREQFGATRFAWDAGPARFIVLDSESTPGRLGAAQLAWLGERLAEPGPAHVFVFVHRPLFPVVGHLEDSLDIDRAERDRLHALLVAHRARIRGVFHGHEHVWCHQDIDGIDYLHAAGGGGKLYAGPQQGGFHHAVLVTATPAGVSTALLRSVPPAPRRPAARLVRPGEPLDAWREAVPWTTWDQSTDLRPAADGAGAEFRYAGASYATPSLAGRFSPPLDLGGVTALRLAVRAGGRGITATLGLGEGAEAGPASPGADAGFLRFDLRHLPAGSLARVEEIGFTFRVPAAAGALGLGPLVAEHPAGDRVLETWTRAAYWYPWNESVSASTAPGGGLAMAFDLRACVRPHVFAPLDPAWDLGGVAGLAIELDGPAGPGLALSLALTGDRRCRAPAVPLGPGRQTVRFAFADWLAASVRRGATRLDLTLAGPPAGTGEVIFRSLSAI